MSIFIREITVPPYQQMFATEECMNEAQRRFFTMLVKSWENGNPISVDSYTSYLFCFFYKVLVLPPEKAAPLMVQIIQAYPGEKKFIEYCTA